MQVAAPRSHFRALIHSTHRSEIDRVAGSLLFLLRGLIFVGTGSTCFPFQFCHSLSTHICLLDILLPSHLALSCLARFFSPLTPSFPPDSYFPSHLTPALSTLPFLLDPLLHSRPTPFFLTCSFVTTYLASFRVLALLLSALNP